MKEFHFHAVLNTQNIKTKIIAQWHMRMSLFLNSHYKNIVKSVTSQPRIFVLQEILTSKMPLDKNS